MSKSTETTNDRVPRVLVRFGKHPSSVWKHPSSVWKHHRAWGNIHQAWGNIHRAWGNTHRAWGSVGVYRGVAEGGWVVWVWGWLFWGFRGVGRFYRKYEQCEILRQTMLQSR